MKARTAQSPDLADAAVLIIETARQLGAGRLNLRRKTDTKWSNTVKQFNSVYDDENLYAEVDN